MTVRQFVATITHAFRRGGPRIPNPPRVSRPLRTRSGTPGLCPQKSLEPPATIRSFGESHPRDGALSGSMAKRQATLCHGSHHDPFRIRQVIPEMASMAPKRSTLTWVAEPPGRGQGQAPSPDGVPDRTREVHPAGQRPPLARRSGVRGAWMRSTRACPGGAQGVAITSGGRVDGRGTRQGIDSGPFPCPAPRAIGPGLNPVSRPHVPPAAGRLQPPERQGQTNDQNSESLN